MWEGLAFLLHLNSLLQYLIIVSPQILFIAIVSLWSGTGYFNFNFNVNVGVDHLDIMQVMVCRIGCAYSIVIVRDTGSLEFL